jgi:hypothetical protein
MQLMVHKSEKLHPRLAYNLIQIAFMPNLPVGKHNWGEKTPNIDNHADPRADDTHPHRYFGAADVDVITIVCW